MLDFRILGPLEVRDGDRSLTPTGAVQRALMAILLLHVNRVVSGDRLVDLLWGDSPPSSGTTALQVRISQLRKALGDGGTVIVTRPPGYLVRLSREQLDLHRFELLVDRAHSDLAAGDLADAATRLREALALWNGPPLADFAYAPFAQAAIARLDEMRLAALESRFEAELAIGQHADLIAELQEAVAEHPLRERLRAQLMLALYRTGRQADALAAFRQGRQFLVDELGIEPGSELKGLELAILRQEPALALADRAPMRAILLAPLTDEALPAILDVAEPLASRPERALVILRAVAHHDELASTTRFLNEQRAALLARGVNARAAAFTSSARARDLLRVAREHDVDLVLVNSPASLLDDPVVRELLISAPCDVALLAGGAGGPRRSFVVVPFGGGEHDWGAIELGAWIATTEQRTLRLVGARGERDGPDASRQLASASLAIQLAFGISSEPHLVPPGPGGLLAAAEGASLIVAGLSDRWQRDGLGVSRTALATQAGIPVLLVRHGLRPSGLAPRASLTRFTWSVAPP